MAVIFVNIILGILQEPEDDSNKPINHSPASLKNAQGADEGFNTFMIVMITVFFVFGLIYMSWIWLLSFRLTKYFGLTRSNLAKNPNQPKYISMYQNDIRVIQGNTGRRGRTRQLQFGMTPDGSFERRPGAPRGI